MCNNKGPAHSQLFACREKEFLHLLLSLLHDVRVRKSPGILVGFDQPAWLTGAGNTAVFRGASISPSTICSLFLNARSCFAVDDCPKEILDRFAFFMRLIHGFLMWVL